MLGSFLRKRQFPYFQPYFKISEKNHSSGGTGFVQNQEITQAVVQGMMNVAAFDLGDVSVRVSTPRAVVSIELCLKDDKDDLCRLYPISGFPRDLGDEEEQQRYSGMLHLFILQSLSRILSVLAPACSRYSLHFFLNIKPWREGRGGTCAHALSLPFITHVTVFS